MKTLTITAIVTLALGAGVANAADAIPPRVYKEPPPPCAFFGGFYIGAHAAYNSWTAHRNDIDGFLTDNAGFTLADNRFGGGLQAGYNYQRGCALIGIEGDGTWSRINDTFTQDGGIGGATGARHSISIKNDWTATLRGRGGFVIGNTLLYLTAGVAWANVETTVVRQFVPPFPLPAFDQHSFGGTRIGGVAGFGVEYNVVAGLTLRGEALYMKFDRFNAAFNAPVVGAPAFGTPPWKFSGSDDVLSLRLGVNYIFGGR